MVSEVCEHVVHISVTPRHFSQDRVAWP